MTLLGRESLLERIDEQDIAKRLVITPLLDRKQQVGPGSVDLRLGTEFLLLRRVRGAGIDPGVAQDAEQDSHDRVVVPFGEAMWLHPRQFALGATLEFLRMPSD
jgi:dCTP deaminase